MDLLFIAGIYLQIEKNVGKIYKYQYKINVN